MEDEQLGVSRVRALALSCFPPNFHSHNSQIHIRVHRRNGRSFITTVQVCSRLFSRLDLRAYLFQGYYF